MRRGGVLFRRQAEADDCSGNDNRRARILFSGQDGCINSRYIITIL